MRTKPNATESRIMESIDREEKEWGAGATIVAAGCTSEQYADTGEPCYECKACEQVSCFSKQPCELCGSVLYGARESAAVIWPGTDKEPVWYSVCIDCIAFLANGEVEETE